MRELTFTSDRGLAFGRVEQGAPPPRAHRARDLPPPPVWRQDRCAAGSHGEVGCRRCVDACHYDAIKVLGRPGGTVVHVAIDACARCGACTAVCPTSALERSFAPDREIYAAIESGLARAPGAAVVLACPDSAGAAPPHAVVVEVPSVAILNETHALQAARLGAREVVVVGRPSSDHGASPAVRAALGVAAELAPHCGFRYVEDDGRELALGPAPGTLSSTPLGPAPGPLAGTRPEITALLLRESASLAPRDEPAGASSFLATVSVEDGSCTLCGACARTCPTEALAYDRAAGVLSARDVDCVRCGLCVRACREGAIALTPGLHAATALERRTLVADAVVPCASCGTPYLPERLLRRVRDVVERSDGHRAGATDEIGTCPACRTSHLGDDGLRRAEPTPSPSPNRAVAPPPPPAGPEGAARGSTGAAGAASGDRRSFLRTAAASVATAAAAMVSQTARAQLRSPPTRRTKRMGMVIDLERCTGCHACTAICKAENDVPLSIYRDWVEEHVLGTYPHARPYFLPKLCNHCDDPGCLRACPTGAIFMRTDGIVDIDHDLCIACRACNQGCPYGAAFMDPVRATADKCTLCSHRVDRGLDPACVDICPSRCRIFGDFDDPESAPSVVLRGANHQVLRRELGLGPNVRYLGLPAELDR